MASDPQIAEPTRTPSRGGYLAAGLVGVLLLVIGINYGFGERTTHVGESVPAGGDEPDIDPARAVTLVRVEGFTETSIVVVHRPQMTVLDAMRHAASVDDNWRFSLQGAGGSAFLTQLGGRGNQRATGQYWQYEVNGQMGEVSFGIRKLEPGDRVLWKLAPYE